MSHQVTNNHTAEINGIAPGATATVSDADMAILINQPPFAAGLLGQPNVNGDGAVPEIYTAVSDEYTLTGAADVHTFFTVAGGSIEILDMWAEVTVALSADVSVAKWQYAANEGPTTTDLGTTVSVASAAKGKRIMMPSAVGSATVVSPVGEAAMNGKGTYMGAPGLAKLNLSGNSTGKLVAYLRYRKIDAAVTVTV